MRLRRTSLHATFGLCLALGAWSGLGAEPSPGPGVPAAASGTGEAVSGGLAWPTLPKDVPVGPGKLDISLESRLRYEYSDNINVRRYGTEEDDHLLLSRTRVGLNYRLPENLHFFVQLQDSRFALSELEQDDWAVSCPHYDQADLKQAYVEWQTILGSPVGLKVGRQSISYAENRVFGPGEWGNVGRYWWDAAKLTLSLSPVQVDFLYGQRVVSEQRSFNDDHYPFRMSALYARWKGLPFTLDTFWLHRYATQNDLKGEDPALGGEDRHTFGTTVDGVWRKRWDYGGTVLGQLGTYAHDEIRTYAAHLRAGYTFEAPWTPRLGAEFCYASGDSDRTDGVRETFDNAYGAVDIPYGWMNVVPWMNLEDYQLTASVKPTPKTKFWIDYHCFRLAEAADAWYSSGGSAVRRDASGSAGRDLGHEVDVLFQWKVSPNLEWLCGYCYFFPGSYIENTPGGDSNGADWFFNQVTMSF